MNDNKNNKPNEAADERKKKEADLNAQIKKDRDYLMKVVREETVKRQEISNNLTKFHEMVDEREADIKEGMKKEYLTDSKMMLEKINAFKKNLDNSK